MKLLHAAGLLIAGTLGSLVSMAQTSPLAPDIPAKFTPPTDDYDYVKRIEMIPMRDGVKLHTVIVVPKGAKRAPMLLTRTPYDAANRASRTKSPRMLATLSLADEVFTADGYIRVYQDVRGKHGSEGEYVMTRPPRGPLNDSKVDHTTDAWDTIDWLVKNVPESNGRVGMIGSSYEGFTVVMALLDPHPALKVAAPESPMIDGWMGDDWFHYGAFRQVNFDYFTGQLGGKSKGDPAIRGNVDDYDLLRRLGSAGAFARYTGIEQLAWWKKITEHPSYDAFWQEQALDRLLTKVPLKVPTLWLQGLWDQEDIWGAVHAYPVLEAKDADNTRNFLVLGPWYHSQINRAGNSLGMLQWEGDTALQVRRDVIKPLFDEYLKDNAPRANTPPVFVFNTGEKKWERHDRWPLAGGDSGVAPTPLFLRENGGLSFTTAAGDNAFDEYVSNPAKPVPYLPRPVKFSDGDVWRRWLVTDQRFVADRPDVLVYQTEPLAQPVRIAGAPVVHLLASTSGTDSDWVVKIVDVFPDEVPAQPEFGGYQLPISLEIFRGRYRESFERAAALEAGKPLRYEFTLPHANHVFLPGHRIMVQIQSTLFPLYDRNPQKFVPNIFLAQPADYTKAVQRIYRGGNDGTRIDLPVVK